MFAKLFKKPYFETKKSINFAQLLLDMNNKNNGEPAPISFGNSEIAFAHKSNFALRKMQLLFEIINQQSLVQIGTSLTEWALRWRLPIKPLI